MSKDKIIVGSRVVVCNSEHPALKFGQGGEVIGITDKGLYRVVFDASTVGRGFIDDVEPEDIKLEVFSFNDDELDVYLVKEFKKSRPVLPKRLFLRDESFDEDGNIETMDITEFEMDNVLELSVNYKSVDVVGVSLTIYFKNYNLYQFSRLLHTRKYQSFTVE
jgi:hypothetical protein